MRFLLLFVACATIVCADSVGRFQLVSAQVTNEATGRTSAGLFRIDTITGDVEELVLTQSEVVLRDGQKMTLMQRGWEPRGSTMEAQRELHRQLQARESLHIETPGPGGMLKDIQRDVANSYQK